jgi:hypothetical protein
MSRPKIAISVQGPILPGSISTARSTCGKPNCRCKQDNRYLHGTYYRWTGAIAGRQTTKTISKKQALECARRIRNYRALQRKLKKLLDQALNNAPWNVPVA